MAVGAGEIASGNAGKSGALRGIRGDRRAQLKVKRPRRGIYRGNLQEGEKVCARAHVCICEKEKERRGEKEREGLGVASQSRRLRRASVASLTILRDRKSGQRVKSVAILQISAAPTDASSGGSQRVFRQVAQRHLHPGDHFETHARAG